MTSGGAGLWLVVTLALLVLAACDPCIQPTGVTGRCRATQWRFTFDNQTNMCVPFIYGGCGGNDNNFGSISSCESVCAVHVARKVSPLHQSCHLPPVLGAVRCRGQFPMFTYDAVEGVCYGLMYGGCGGSLNLYHSMDQCMARCVTGPNVGVLSPSISHVSSPLVSSTERCLLPPVWPGPLGCTAFVPMFHYSRRDSACVPYLYSGCRATPNLYNTSQECEAACNQANIAQHPSADVCSTPITTGPCKAAKWVFGFNQKNGRCEQFIYGGCGGNGNNFDTMEDCVNTCGGGEPSVSHDCHSASCDQHEEDFHKAKGCLPVTLPGDCCPSSWDCSPWERRRTNSTVCFYSNEDDPIGKFYNIGESIGSLPGCRAGCRCVTGASGRAEIVCAVVDCPPPHPAFSWDRCVPQYDNIDQCCMATFKCDADKDALAECTLDGQTYRNGQKMYPEEDPCLVCLCHPGWNGTLTGPGCRRVDCGLQLQHDYLFRGCTPLYRDDVCCPVDWICPDQVQVSDAIITGRNTGSAIQPDDKCLLPKDMGLCEAIIPQFYFDMNSRTCQSFNYGGCEGNQNRFNLQEECENTCEKYRFELPALPPAAREECTGEKQPGPCKGFFKKWYHDSSTGKCQQFIFGGCQGNKNNFDSLDECEARCSVNPGLHQLQAGKNPICNEPVKKGKCRSRIEKYYYDQNTGLCKQFYYSGCQGGLNMFGDLEDCVQTCVQPNFHTRAGAGQDLLISNPCDQEKQIGPCKAAKQRWFFNKLCGTCEKFLYGGCLGNENNFESVAECESVCIPRIISSPPTKNRIITAGGVSSLPARVNSSQGRAGAGKVIHPKPGCPSSVLGYSGQVAPPQEPMARPGGPMVGGLMAGRPMPGGLQDSPIDKEVKMAAVMAVKNLASISFITGTECSHVHLIEVVKASKQVVAGTNLHLTLRLGIKSGPTCHIKKEKTCSNIVVFKPLPHACQELHGCLQVNSANAKCVETDGDQILGGFSSHQVDGESRIVANTVTNQLIGAAAVTTCNHIELIEIVNVEKQIVAGTNFIFTLNLRSRGGSQCNQIEEKICSKIKVFKPLPYACSEDHGCLQLDTKQVFCTTVKQSQGYPILGGVNQVNIDDEITRIAEVVSGEIVGIAGDDCNHTKFVQIENVSSQIVAGTNYVFTLRISTKSGPGCDQEKEKICSNILVFKPLPYACSRNDGCLETNSENVTCHTVKQAGPKISVGRAVTLPARIQPDDPCTLDKEVGPCRAHMPRFFFDKTSKTCQSFIFGGCRENENNFRTLEACEAQCGHQLRRSSQSGGRRRPMPHNPICQLAMDTGPCFALMPRYYFNLSSRRCEEFQYGGCQGNANNFARLGDCVSTCGKHPRALPGQEPPPQINSSPRCHFGNSTYKVGDILRFDSSPCNSCICSSPPHLTCRQENGAC